jgi:hypothetical protein
MSADKGVTVITGDKELIRTSGVSGFGGFDSIEFGRELQRLERFLGGLLCGFVYVL